MEVLEGLGKIANIFSGAMSVKSEADYWNSHSHSFKMVIVAQVFFGSILGIFAYWSLLHNPVGTVNATVPLLVACDYVCICWALNSQRCLNEKSFKSDNFSEFCKFGFFKGDDFIGGIIFGWLFAAILTYEIFASVVLHQTIAIDIGSNSVSVKHLEQAAPLAATHSPTHQVARPMAHHAVHPVPGASHNVHSTAHKPSVSQQNVVPAHSHSVSE